MQIADIEMFINALNRDKKLPTSLQDNPVDQIKFDNGTNLEAFLNQSELETYNRLKNQLQEVNQTLKEHGHPHIEEIFYSFEEITGNLNALSMNATFREGLLQGFRLAQFFLQGTYKQEHLPKK
ncbi:hypothetical protein [Desulforamulus reducens]|nr:hypothetical protein [Desulforamulus reducens]